MRQDHSRNKPPIENRIFSVRCAGIILDHARGEPAVATYTAGVLPVWENKDDTAYYIRGYEYLRGWKSSFWFFTGVFRERFIPRTAADRDGSIGCKSYNTTTRG